MSEAEDYDKYYSHERTRIEQGLVAFGSSDKRDVLSAVKLLLVTSRLYKALSKGGMSVFQSEHLVEMYNAKKQGFNQDSGVRFDCIVAIDFLISMLTSYQSHLLRHYQDNIEHGALSCQHAEELAAWCVQKQKQLARQLPQSPVVALTVGDINQLISSLTVYIYRSKLFECLRLDQMKIHKGELSLDHAQASLNKWDEIESNALTHAQGNFNGAFDSLLVAIKHLKVNLTAYVQSLTHIEPQVFNPDGFLNFSQEQPPEGSNASHTTNKGSDLHKMSIAEYLFGSPPKRQRL